MKNIIKIFLVFAAVIFLFAACGQTEEEIIDVSDVKDMIFGSEMPNILYYSKEKAIIDGPFGVVVYDLENRRLTDRITFDKIHEWGMTGYFNFTSADGETVYITDMRQIDGVMTSMVAYDVESKTASPAKNITGDEIRESSWAWDGGRFQAETIDPYNPYDMEYKKYYEYFGKYFEQNCLIGYAIVTNENEFVFLTVPKSFMAYDTQIVISGSNGGEKVYRIFNDEE